MIQKIHQSMGDDSSVAEKLYIRRDYLEWENFLFVSLYSFSCIARQRTTLKKLQHMSCLDSLIRTLSPFWLVLDITLLSPIPSTPSVRNGSG